MFMYGSPSPAVHYSFLFCYVFGQSSQCDRMEMPSTFFRERLFQAACALRFKQLEFLDFLFQLHLVVPQPAKASNEEEQEEAEETPEDHQLVANFSRAMAYVDLVVIHVFSVHSRCIAD
mmetsp:Transcript_29486/g.48236  ORF Transcript_29486/g.48236 Transcript_29486/m.48236 type:complete len:119 (+) Transcript_29486:3-359(+)